MSKPLADQELTRLDAYWRAANYLSVGQIYLLDNPLLREPLRVEHIKPRLLGHWGTTPGLNFVYAHLNRAIRERDLNAIYVCGPGHGGPGMVANAYLEGTYTERYTGITQDADGLQRLFRQFSFPGGIPSHAAPETPGSINEGGELGYSLAHAYGAAFDNPDLLVACVVGDGEAETGPLATSWHSNKFLDPATDGAVLPILHLNGYKIANPTVLARISRRELECLFEGYGYEPFVVEGDDPPVDAPADGRDAGYRPGSHRRHPARGAAAAAGRGRAAALADDRAADAQGLDRPEGGRRPARRGHLARPPGAAGRRRRPTRSTCAQLEAWLRSYRPEELFDADGRLMPELAALAPRGRPPDERQSRTPTAACCCATSACRTSATTPSTCRSRARASARRPGCSAASCATSCGRAPTSATSGSWRRTSWPRTGSERRWRRPTGPGWPSACPATITWRRTAG